MKYITELMADASCAVCRDPLDKVNIIMTNPCGHILCSCCACQYVRIWQDEAEPNPRCPMCRQVLLDHKFTKAESIKISKINCTSLFIWVPSSMYTEINHDQKILEALTRDHMEIAFAYAFLLGRGPTHAEKIINPDWENYYYHHIENICCSCCYKELLPTEAFISLCHHFYCTVCASCISERLITS